MKLHVMRAPSPGTKLVSPTLLAVCPVWPLVTVPSVGAQLPVWDTAHSFVFVSRFFYSVCVCCCPWVM